MNDDIIRIAKRDTARGEDGYKTFSVRIKEDTVAALDNIILDFGVTHTIIEE